MRLICMDVRHHQSYDEFLLQIDTSLLYYSRSYKILLESLLSCRSQYWLAVNGENIEGILPLMEMDGPYGRVINSLPYYGSNGGIIALTDAARVMLCEKYNDIVNESGLAAATLITHPLLSQSDYSVNYDMTDQRLGQLTPLPESGDIEEQMLSLIDSSTRRNIRKAERSSVSVRIDNQDINFLYQTHIENMSMIGGKAKDISFFEGLANHFRPGKEFRIYKAEIDGEPVAALLVFYFNHTVEYFTPVTRGKYRNAQPMAKILFEAMVDAARSGYRWWNWGGTWLSQEGVYRFKKKWGAEEHPYTYYTKINNSALLSCSQEELLSAYPGFYVLPFGKLNNTGVPNE